MLMTLGKKYTLSTSIFYIVLLALIPILNRCSPSGPCTPGLGMLLFLLTLLLAPFAFLYSFIGLLCGHRSFTGPMVINAVVALGLVILLSSGQV
jgi:hypothetical protein